MVSPVILAPHRATRFAPDIKSKQDSDVSGSGSLFLAFWPDIGIKPLEKAEQCSTEYTQCLKGGGSK